MGRKAAFRCASGPPRRVYRSSVALLSVLVLLLSGLVACGAQRGGVAAAPGEVVSVTPVLGSTTEQTADYLKEWAIQTPVRNGIDAYRVVYRTSAPDGADTTASGLVVLPRTEARRLPVVSYAHGTIVRKDEAPSADAETDRARTALFAAVGYAAVAPDYLGLGEGPGSHPYAHVPTEASASADLLRAARMVAAREGREFDGTLLVTGFSQGGQAAMALAERVATAPDLGFTLAGVAAVSGPYAVREVQTPAALDGRISPRAAVLYIAYWLTAMNRIYRLYDEPGEAFQPPYAERVEQLFDGRHDILSVSTGLPATPRELLTPRFQALALDPTGEALRAMTDSDGACDWTPRAPVRLYVSSDDRAVPAANAERCRAALGDRASVVDLGPVDHSATVRLALPGILAWFGELTPAP
ncbi:alpha/beta hydrolase family protein [Nocardia lijiangensis]|uniref:alpha/beta hydrolase family protein n=1 Tax=Nocardia lijiangensis TaxID=299618 RepID=UPI003D704FAC